MLCHIIYKFSIWRTGQWTQRCSNNTLNAPYLIVHIQIVGTAIGSVIIKDSLAIPCCCALFYSICPHKFQLWWWETGQSDLLLRGDLFERNVSVFSGREGTIKWIWKAKDEAMGKGQKQQKGRGCPTGTRIDKSVRKWPGGPRPWFTARPPLAHVIIIIITAPFDTLAWRRSHSRTVAANLFKTNIPKHLQSNYSTPLVITTKAVTLVLETVCNNSTSMFLINFTLKF